MKRILFAGMIAAIPLPVMAANPPCTGAADLCETQKHNLDHTAEALITAYTAEEYCGAYEVDQALASEVWAQWPADIRNSYQELKADIRTRFEKSREAACTLAFRLYGPFGTTMVLGQHNRPVQGLLRFRRTGGFVGEFDQRH